MATVTVNTVVNLIQAIRDSAAGDTIKIAPGVYGRFVFPKSINYALTITAADPANPPIMRGIRDNDSDAAYWTLNQTGPIASFVNRVWYNNLRFICERISSVEQSNGSHVTTLAPDGEGFGWRADYSYPGGTLGTSSGFTGLRITGSDVKVTDCLFDGFATQINCGGSVRAIIVPSFPIFGNRAVSKRTRIT